MVWDGESVAERWLLSQEEERNGRLVAETRSHGEDGRLNLARMVSLTAESRVAELEAELRRLRGE